MLLLKGRRGSQIRVAQVCHRYYPTGGGIQTHVAQVSKMLARKGLQIEVLTTDPSGVLPKEQIVDGITVKRFKSWAPRQLLYSSRPLLKYLMTESWQYDVVHVHNYSALPALYAALAKKKNALVFTPHYSGRTGWRLSKNLMHMAYRPIGKRIFRRSDRVVCVSSFEKRLLMQDFGLLSDRLLVVPNGVDIRELSRYKWTPQSSPVKITYAGRLIREKNLEALLEAFSMLQKMVRFEPVLVIIGSGPDELFLRALAMKLRIQDRITWKGWLNKERYLEEMASSSVFVMPSEHECYCISAAEAIALGVPTVLGTGPNAALSEFVLKGLALGVTAPITGQRIAEAVIAALNSRKEIRRSQWQGSICSWDYVAERLYQLYSEVLHG